jgi:hypothetical protein
MSASDLIGPGLFIDPVVIQAASRDGTHRYPYAVWTPLPETATQTRIDTTTFILHSMAGPRLTTLEAISRYYMRDDITGEPTFALDMVGRACQYMHTDQRADNNAKANRFAASIETQDAGADLLPTTPWTDPQVAQLAGMAAYLHLAEGVPLKRPGAWDAGGVDGHRAFPEWSIYVGKTCPGDARWAQIPEVLELAVGIATWAPPPLPSEEGDMMPRPFLFRPVSNHYQYTVSDGIVARRVRSAQVDELQAAIDVGIGPIYIDPVTRRPITNPDAATWPVVSDDMAKLLGVETIESLNQ